MNNTSNIIEGPQEKKWPTPQKIFEGGLGYHTVVGGLAPPRIQG